MQIYRDDTKPVLVLDMDGVWFEFVYLVRDRPPPVPARHVDERDDAFALAVGVGNNVSRARGISLADELQCFLCKRCDAAKARRPA